MDFIIQQTNNFTKPIAISSTFYNSQLKDTRLTERILKICDKMFTFTPNDVDDEDTAAVAGGQ